MREVFFMLEGQEGAPIVGAKNEGITPVDPIVNEPVSVVNQNSDSLQQNTGELLSEVRAEIAQESQDQMIEPPVTGGSGEIGGLKNPPDDLTEEIYSNPREDPDYADWIRAGQRDFLYQKTRAKTGEISEEEADTSIKQERMRLAKEFAEKYPEKSRAYATSNPLLQQALDDIAKEARDVVVAGTPPVAPQTLREEEEEEATPSVRSADVPRLAPQGTDGEETPGESEEADEPEPAPITDTDYQVYAEKKIQDLQNQVNQDAAADEDLREATQHTDTLEGMRKFRLKVNEFLSKDLKKKAGNIGKVTAGVFALLSIFTILYLMKAFGKASGGR